MNIAVNMTRFRAGKMGGIEPFVTNLIEEMARTSDHHFYLFLPQHQKHLLRIEGRNVKKIGMAMDDSVDNLLRTWIGEWKMDYLFSPFFDSCPKGIDTPTFILVPDLQHQYFPEFFHPTERMKRDQTIIDAKKSGARIITISHFCKQTLIEKYGLHDSQLEVVYGDAPKEFHDQLRKQKLNRIRKKYNLPDVFGLYPANFWPHKNHPNLLKALNLLKQTAGPKISLVFTGYEQENFSYVKTIKKMVQELDLEDQVSFLGYLPKKEMPFLYHDADFLVYPSLFEGFGIPLVEAMRTDTPIAAANAGSIPEIVQSAALLFDPFDPNDIAEKMQQMMKETIRKSLIAKGKERAAYFSWEKSAQTLLQLFNR